MGRTHRQLPDRPAPERAPANTPIPNRRSVAVRGIDGAAAQEAALRPAGGNFERQSAALSPRGGGHACNPSANASQCVAPEPELQWVTDLQEDMQMSIRPEDMPAPAEVSLPAAAAPPPQRMRMAGSSPEELRERMRPQDPRVAPALPPMPEWAASRRERLRESQADRTIPLRSEPVRGGGDATAPLGARDSAEEIREMWRRNRRERAVEEIPVVELSPEEQTEAVCEAAYPVSDADRRLYERVSERERGLADPRTGFCADMDGRGGPAEHAIREVAREAINIAGVDAGHEGEIRPALPNPVPGPDSLLPEQASGQLGVISTLENVMHAARDVEDAWACAHSDDNSAMFRRMAIEREAARNPQMDYHEARARHERVEQVYAQRRECYERRSPGSRPANRPVISAR